MSVAEAIARGELRGRLWFYTNYHCNIACKYCLTESRPQAPRRLLDETLLLTCAQEARDLGFLDFGVTGGEPFLRPDMTSILRQLASIRPTLVLTNGTLFSDRLIDEMRTLAHLPVAVQFSLDSSDEKRNDAMRDDGTHRNVVAAIPRLKQLGIRVRIGSTVDEEDPDSIARLRQFVANLGVDADDHIIRPIARVGRAETNDLGIAVSQDNIVPELTLTAEGAFLSPAAPFVKDDRLDIRMLLTRVIQPVAIPAAAMLRFVSGHRTPSEVRITCA